MTLTSNYRKGGSLLNLILNFTPEVSLLSTVGRLSKVMGQILKTTNFSKNAVNVGSVGVRHQQSGVDVEVCRGLLSPGYMKVMCCEEIGR